MNTTIKRTLLAATLALGGFSVSSPMLSTEAEASCNSARSVLSRCSQDMRDGVRNTFRSTTVPDRASSVRDAVRRCHDCAMTHIRGSSRNGGALN